MAGIYWLIGLCITVPLILKFFDTGNPFFALPGIVMLALTLYTFICVGAHSLWNRIKWNYYEKEDVGSTTVTYSDFHKDVYSYKFQHVKFVYAESGKHDYGILKHDEHLPIEKGNWIYHIVCALPRNYNELVKMTGKCELSEAEYVDGAYYVHVPRR